MEKLIASSGNYDIWESDTAHLYELSRFAVLENYRHHAASVCDTETLYAEIGNAYQDDLQFTPCSRVFVARNAGHRLIGSIRITQWNYETELPMQKLFGNDPLRKLLSGNKHHPIWHIGRFAVAQSVERPFLSLFKQLIVCAVFSVMYMNSGIMIAECDRKLTRALSALGVRINTLGMPVCYLGSETVPVSITRQGIAPFFAREYSNLLQKSSCIIRDTLSDMEKFTRINICA